MKYAKDLMFKFGMHSCKAAAIPMNANEKFQLKDGTDLADPSHYRSLIGGLNYLTYTHPDIMFSVSMFSRLGICIVLPSNILVLPKKYFSWIHIFHVLVCCYPHHRRLWRSSGT